jgi:hypothetical protein
MSQSEYLPDILRKKLQDAHDRLVMEVGSGKLSLEDYRYQSGRARGLKDALNIVSDALKVALAEDN